RRPLSPTPSAAHPRRRRPSPSSPHPHPCPLVLARNPHPWLGFRPPPLTSSGSAKSGDGEARGGRIWHRSTWLWMGRRRWQEGRTSMGRVATKEMEILLHPIWPSPAASSRSSPTTGPSPSATPGTMPRSPILEEQKEGCI
uniref:Uncharacterized protein n=1 Tax=Triticum urartu TaxID=4572 RepID=A0A8R7QSJ5_TRIUA